MYRGTCVGATPTACRVSPSFTRSCLGWCRKIWEKLDIPKARTSRLGATLGRMWLAGWMRWILLWEVGMRPRSLKVRIVEPISSEKTSGSRQRSYRLFHCSKILKSLCQRFGSCIATPEYRVRLRYACEHPERRQTMNNPLCIWRHRILASHAHSPAKDYSPITYSYQRRFMFSPSGLPSLHCPNRQYDRRWTCFRHDNMKAYTSSKDRTTNKTWIQSEERSIQANSFHLPTHLYFPSPSFCVVKRAFLPNPNPSMWFDAWQTTHLSISLHFTGSPTQQVQSIHSLHSSTRRRSM